MRLSIYGNKDTRVPEDELCLRMNMAFGDRVQVIAVNPHTGRKLDGREDRNGYALM